MDHLAWDFGDCEGRGARFKDLAFDCDYNRSTTENKALFFGNSAELQQLVESLDKAVADKVGLDMLEIAHQRYTWSIVAQQYFSLLGA